MHHRGLSCFRIFGQTRKHHTNTKGLDTAFLLPLATALVRQRRKARNVRSRRVGRLRPESVGTMGERRVGPLFSFRAEDKHGTRTGQETHTGPGRDRTRTRVLDGTRGDSTLAHAVGGRSQGGSDP